MALGFGFNRTKVLASAEKNVQQGKFQNAINDYLKVVKEDPKDLTILNTVGDLYARLGQNDQAIVCFKKVGDSYAGGGFTVKAIAMYKKIAKIDAHAIDSVLRLAELYTQQGLYNDARSQYMIVAESYMKTADLASAARIFQKMLELDPENAAMQSKLADLYVRTGKKEDARNIFFSAAQSLFMRGALDGADEALGKVLNLDPDNVAALQLRGQIASDSGNAAAAVQYLEQIPDLDSRPDAMRPLMRAKLALGANPEAEAIAKKLLTVHNDTGGITTYAEALLNAGDAEGALKVYEQYADRLLATNPVGTLQVLHNSINQIKDKPRALEILLALCRRAGDTSHMGEVMELLAHAHVQENDLAKARDLYHELAQLEPENELHMQHYRRLSEKIGDDVVNRPMTAEEGQQAFMVDELEVEAPKLEQKYDEDVTEAVKAAITDAELFESYNQPEKAIEPLERALPRAPRDAQINHRLASLYARCNRWADAAARCEVLRGIYGDSGHEAEARKYADMAAKYRRSAGVPAIETAASEPVAAEFSIAVPTPEPAAASAPAASAPAKEIDLSDEWESMTVTDTAPPTAAPAPAAAPSANITDLLDEARFYLSQSMMSEARGAVSRLLELAPQNSDVLALQRQMEGGKPAEAPAAEFSVEVPTPSSAPEFSVAAESAPAQPEAAAAPPPAEFSVEVEPPLPSPAAPAPAPPVVAAPPPPPPVTPQPARAAAHASDALGDLAMGLEDSLGDDFSLGKAAPPAPPARAAAAASAPAPAASAAPAPAAASPGPAVPLGQSKEHHDELSDIFEEFKEDVEESAPQEEDPQTHYNLGIAFKEMGLLDEAIGELQKVAQAIDHGASFSENVQAYTLLASSFLEKGGPGAAVKWYERALKSPGLHEESVLAIQYELAAAHEAAGDRTAALKNFMSVYSSNIDYRDVAERIKTLKA